MSDHLYTTSICTFGFWSGEMTSLALQKIRNAFTFNHEGICNYILEEVYLPFLKFFANIFQCRCFSLILERGFGEISSNLL